MPKLEIHLNEGFAGDSVEIRVGGAPPVAFENVSTDYSLGLAKKTQFELPAGHCRVDVAIRGGPTATTDLTIDADLYLSVRKEGGQLHFSPSNSPTAYF
jgi:hypothetical protein